MFRKNLGPFGRLIRLALSAFLFYYAYENRSYIALGFAVFTLYEALFSWCIVYQILGINQCPIDKK
jgi:hypothetical protein